MKKRHTYGTAMIDIETHRIIDMIPSRDAADVKAWLRGYPNVTVVSRDGSNAYRNAVAEALPWAIQVSDRFHLLKNLTDYSKEYLKKELGKTVRVASAGVNAPETPPVLSKAEDNRKLTKKEKCGRIMDLIGSGYGKTAICRELNLDARTYDKLAAVSPDGAEIAFRLKNARKHEENVKRKQAVIDEVREQKSHGFSNREISRRTGLSPKTVSKYLCLEFNPSSASYGVKRGGALAPFAGEIDQMLSLGLKGSAIESLVRENGYQGSSSNIRVYISDWKRNRKQDYDKCRPEASKTEAIERKNLLKLLYHPLEDVKDITETQFQAAIAEYPAFAKIHGIVWEFKGILAAKDENALKPWLERAISLGVSEINSFAAGINQDIDAVTNAVALPYSNGLAEGSINKIKAIKRVMYGRCGFELLRSKILGLESLKSVN